MSALTPAVRDDLAAQVWERLDTVSDPELDESVTALGFVTSVEVDSNGATKIAFRLPTYWCAANFAFLMADDMRAAASALPWVTQISIELADHMFSQEINAGVSNGRSFQQSFGAAASDDLAALRATFLVKAFQGRQEALLSALLDRGHDPDALLALTVSELEALAPLDERTTQLVKRYVERRFVVGALADNGRRMASIAFVDNQGAPLIALSLGRYLREIRRVRVNAEFNGALCRGLLAARYEDATEKPVADNIHPIHFIARQTYQENASRRVSHR